MKKNLIMFNMSHRFEWERGVINRNAHVLNNIIDRGIFQTVISVDFLPFNTRKRAKVMLKARPWKRNADTVFYRLNTRVDKDQKRKGLYGMTSLNLKHLPEVMKQLAVREEETVMWSYNPLVAPELERYNKAFHIFDAVDNWIEHSSYADQKEHIQECYASIKKNSDVIFTVSEGLVDFFERQSNVFYIPNGVDAEDFENAACDKTLLPKQLQEKKQTIIGYHGIIQSRVNFSIFSYLAEKHPTWQFLIIGPVWKEVEPEIKALKKFKNIHILDFVPYAKLPAVISCFDATIIPHKVDAFTHSMNPLKMYEYLAAGKPIVSTPIAGAEQFQDLIALSISPEDFSTNLEGALKNDSDKLRQRRKQMAKEYSWNNRVDLMMDIIAREELQATE